MPLRGIVFSAFGRCVNLDAQEKWTGFTLKPFTKELTGLGCEYLP